MAGGNMLRVTHGLSLLNIHTTQWNASCRCVSNRAILEKLGLPEKPKKPPTPFLVYKCHIWEQLQKQNPNGLRTAVEVARKAGQLWKDVSMEEKAKLTLDYRKNYEKYKIELEKYNMSLTPQQKKELHEAQEDIKVMKEQRQIKLDKDKRSRELNKPKHPLLPFTRFVLKCSVQRDKDEGRGDFMRKISIEWKKLSQEEKKIMVDEYIQELKTYQKDLEEWEEEMIRLGNMDLVRLKTLKKKLTIYS